jgi:hypothetical protein
VALFTLLQAFRSLRSRLGAFTAPTIVVTDGSVDDQLRLSRGAGARIERTCTMRTAIPTLVATGALAIAGWHAPLRAQGALGGVGGLGELIGSFVTRQAYVGSTRVTLLQLRDPTPRLALHGFSIATPAAAGWYLAYPEPSRADVVQAVWFVKDPHRFTAWAKGNRIPARPLSLMATLRFYGNTSAGGFPSRLKELKTAEWTAGGVRVLALETRPMRLSNVECAEYEATLVDRRAPFG